MANYYTKKVCRFCADKVEDVDYKDVKLLQRYINSYGKIESRKRSGNCLKHQRRVAVALKRARHIALIPFVVR
ncbi:MAG TPA: 30S ribosomal protein S18 [Candidatus Saccharimonadales bacterium]|nr:30S ribosomal protein S18 [Candidatus Saccharimonadales bacterium]